MKSWIVGGVSAVLLTACSQKLAEKDGHVRAAGTLALSQDDALLYAVDADNEFVAVVDAETRAKVAEVKVGKWPEQILVAPDDTVYVANRGDRSVSVFTRGAWQWVDRIPVGVEPVGLALSGDAKTLYVVNAASLTDADRGSLIAIDHATRQPRWEMELPSDPRGIAVVEGERAVISRYRPGDLIEVDLARQQVVRSGTSLRSAVNGDFETGFSTVTPRAMGQVVVDPHDLRVYAPVVWSSDAVLNATTTSTGSGGAYGGGGGGCGRTGAVTTPGIATFGVDELSPLVESIQGCPNGFDVLSHPSTVMRDPMGEPVQGPTALVLDASGSWLYVANRESDNVAVVPTSGGFDPSSGSNVREVIKVGSAPTGLALSRDGLRLYVHNSFSHDIHVIVSSGSQSRLEVEGAPIEIADDVLPPDVVEGRRLFFSATDVAMNSPQVGISCGSCHLEGREDGHVWNFNEGPRQTPSLAGRMVPQTAPFHWGGEHADFGAFVDVTVGERMGGRGLTGDQQRKLLAFIDTLPAPDNPHKYASPTEAQVRGAQAFQKAGCNECHAGAALTNNTFADVGTFVTGRQVNDDRVFLSKGLNTPSLLGVARTGPYLHDGSAATLRDRVMFDRQRGSDAHGKVSLLTDPEVDDLVAFLKAL